MCMKEVGGGGSVQGEVRVGVVLRWVLGVGGEGEVCRRDRGHVLSCAFCIRDGGACVWVGVGNASGCSCGVFVCKQVCVAWGH